MKQEYLTEENYLKIKRKIGLIAFLILLIGLSIGGFLIYKGLDTSSSKNLEVYKQDLYNKKQELENSGVKFSAFTKYTDGKSYDLKIITEALDPSFSHCSFDEYKNNEITKDYCEAKNSTSEFHKIPFLMFGGFVILATLMISGSIYMSTKQREMLIYNAQGIMPIAQEGIEKMAPTIGKAQATIAKEVAPAYGEIAKEISKGIKEGLKKD